MVGRDELARPPRRCSAPSADAAKRLENAPSIGWRPLAERYIDGEVRIHVHLRQAHGLDGHEGRLAAVGTRVHLHDRLGERTVGAPDDPSAPDLCWTYEFPRRTLGDDLELDITRIWERFYREHVSEFDGRIDQMKVAVLVDVPEFLKHREGFTVGGFFPQKYG